MEDEDASNIISQAQSFPDQTPASADQPPSSQVASDTPATAAPTSSANQPPPEFYNIPSLEPADEPTSPPQFIPPAAPVPIPVLTRPASIKSVRQAPSSSFLYLSKEDFKTRYGADIRDYSNVMGMMYDSEIDPEKFLNVFSQMVMTGLFNNSSIAAGVDAFGSDMDRDPIRKILSAINMGGVHMPLDHMSNLPSSMLFAPEQYGQGAVSNHAVILKMTGIDWLVNNVLAPLHTQSGGNLDPMLENIDLLFMLRLSVSAGQDGSAKVLSLGKGSSSKAPKSPLLQFLNDFLTSSNAKIVEREEEIQSIANQAAADGAKIDVNKLRLPEMYAISDISVAAGSTARANLRRKADEVMESILRAGGSPFDFRDAAYARAQESMNGNGSLVDRAANDKLPTEVLQMAWRTVWAQKLRNIIFRWFRRAFLLSVSSSSQSGVEFFRALSSESHFQRSFQMMATQFSAGGTITVPVASSPDTSSSVSLTDLLDPLIFRDAQVNQGARNYTEFIQAISPGLEEAAAAMVNDPPVQTSDEARENTDRYNAVKGFSELFQLDSSKGEHSLHRALNNPVVSLMQRAFYEHYLRPVMELHAQEFLRVDGSSVWSLDKMPVTAETQSIMLHELTIYASKTMQFLTMGDVYKSQFRESRNIFSALKNLLDQVPANPRGKAFHFAETKVTNLQFLADFIERFNNSFQNSPNTIKKDLGISITRELIDTYEKMVTVEKQMSGTPIGKMDEEADTSSTNSGSGVHIQTAGGTNPFSQLLKVDKHFETLYNELLDTGLQQRIEDVAGENSNNKITSLFERYLALPTISQFLEKQIFIMRNSASITPSNFATYKTDDELAKMLAGKYPSTATTEHQRLNAQKKDDLLEKLKMLNAQIKRDWFEQAGILLPILTQDKVKRDNIHSLVTRSLEHNNGERLKAILRDYLGMQDIFKRRISSKGNRDPTDRPLSKDLKTTIQRYMNGVDSTYSRSRKDTIERKIMSTAKPYTIKNLVLDMFSVYVDDTVLMGSSEILDLSPLPLWNQPTATRIMKFGPPESSSKGAFRMILPHSAKYVVLRRNNELTDSISNNNVPLMQRKSRVFARHQRARDTLSGLIGQMALRPSMLAEAIDVSGDSSLIASILAANAPQMVQRSQTVDLIGQKSDDMRRIRALRERSRILKNHELQLRQMDMQSAMKTGYLGNMRNKFDGTPGNSSPFVMECSVIISPEIVAAAREGVNEFTGIQVEFVWTKKTPRPTVGENRSIFFIDRKPTVSVIPSMNALSKHVLRSTLTLSAPWDSTRQTGTYECFVRAYRKFSRPNDKTAERVNDLGGNEIAAAITTTAVSKANLKWIGGTKTGNSVDFLVRERCCRSQSWYNPFELGYNNEGEVEWNVTREQYHLGILQDFAFTMSLFPATNKGDGRGSAQKPASASQILNIIAVQYNHMIKYFQEPVRKPELRSFMDKLLPDLGYYLSREGYHELFTHTQSVSQVRNAIENIKRNLNNVPLTLRNVFSSQSSLWFRCYVLIKYMEHLTNQPLNSSTEEEFYHRFDQARVDTWNNVLTEIVSRFETQYGFVLNNGREELAVKHLPNKKKHTNVNGVPIKTQYVRLLQSLCRAKNSSDLVHLGNRSKVLSETLCDDIFTNLTRYDEMLSERFITAYSADVAESEAAVEKTLQRVKRLKNYGISDPYQRKDGKVIKMRGSNSSQRVFSGLVHLRESPYRTQESIAYKVLTQEPVYQIPLPRYADWGLPVSGFLSVGGSPRHMAQRIWNVKHELDEAIVDYESARSDLFAQIVPLVPENRKNKVSDDALVYKIIFLLDLPFVPFVFNPITRTSNSALRPVGRNESDDITEGILEIFQLNLLNLEGDPKKEDFLSLKKRARSKFEALVQQAGYTSSNNNNSTNRNLKISTFIPQRKGDLYDVYEELFHEGFIEEIIINQLVLPPNSSKPYAKENIKHKARTFVRSFIHMRCTLSILNRLIEQSVGLKRTNEY